MPRKNLVSVIVINYNGCSLLPVCLGSLAGQSYADLEIILVDNGSSDGSREFVKDNFPRAKIIENEVNLGFAKAADQGIENSEGEFVALLNNDTRADKDWVANLVRAAAADPTIGSCASKQLNFFDPRMIDSAGILLFRGGYPRNRGRGETDNGQFDTAGEIFGAPGASAFYRRSMLDQIGLFDSDYFAYCEEFDLSFRAQLAGWKCEYVPEAVIYHMGGQTRSRNEQGFLVYYSERNRIFTIIKNYPAGLILYYLPFLLKYELDAFIRLIKHSEKGLLIARLDALKLLPKMLKKRRRIQKDRKVGISGLRGFFLREKRIVKAFMDTGMKPRVLMIDAGGWGGISHYTYNLMQELSFSGKLECALLTDLAYELDRVPRSFKIIKRGLNGQPYLLAAIRLIREIFIYKPDVIHIQTMLSVRKDFFLFLLARLFGINIVLTAHNILPHEDAQNRAFFMHPALKTIYSCSKVIIVHSKFSADRLVKLFDIPLKKIRVISHGNYLFFRTSEMSMQEARRILGINGEKKVIIQFGAMRDYKGIDILLDAFAKVKAKNGSAYLVIVGKPINLDIEPIMQRIRDCDLRNDVLFKAEYIPFDRIAAYFFASDVAVFPYKEIDMSGSLQLAYAFGKPVVCARSGGLPEAVAQGKNGLLVEPNDGAALEAGLLSLLDDPELIRAMGEESLRMAKEDFSWKGIALSTAGVYHEFLRG